MRGFRHPRPRSTTETNRNPLRTNSHDRGGRSSGSPTTFPTCWQLSKHDAAVPLPPAAITCSARQRPLRAATSSTGAEVRTWWVDGGCRLMTAHPDTADQPVPVRADVPGLAAAVVGPGLPFVTVDLARRVDGRWRVVELGDGQVSDRPATTPAEDLFSTTLSSRN
ncbi:ATP-grasp domain-containing protein [Paractinoplanes globisporus]|uniref:ATP-grasp domain-containing protein n=1 Tax=Paractinoplanes globisporus TaxID=113565 RepID=A0ABW6WIG5_9ACTN|nr:ATP-grasp domain-containing protein [Actinoplanes globisporus]